MGHAPASGMIRLSGRIEFVDGTVTEYSTGGAALAKYERLALKRGWPIGKDAPPMLSALVIAHHALGVEEDFDTWCETVEDISLDHEDNAVPPTPPAATAA